VVTSRSEIVYPGEVDNTCAEAGGDVFGAVSRAGVGDNDLVEDPRHRLEAPTEGVLFVLDNDAQTPGEHRQILARAGLLNALISADNLVTVSILR